MTTVLRYLILISIDFAPFLRFLLSFSLDWEDIISKLKAKFKTSFTKQLSSQCLEMWSNKVYNWGYNIRILVINRCKCCNSIGWDTAHHQPLLCNALVWSTKLYTCQLFPRYRRGSVIRFLKTTQSFPMIPDEVRSLPKNSEESRKCPKSQSQFKRELAPSAFHFKNQRSRGRYCHLFILHMVFVPYMGLS